MRTNRPHAIVPVIPSRERVNAAHGRPCAAAPERATVRRPQPLHPPLGGRRREEPGRGGVGVSEGWVPHGKRRWGVDALARGFACCLHITSKGESPAYRLSLCRRSSGHGMLHISHMQRQRVLAQLRMYCWCRGPLQSRQRLCAGNYFDIRGAE